MKLIVAPSLLSAALSSVPSSSPCSAALSPAPSYPPMCLHVTCCTSHPGRQPTPGQLSSLHLRIAVLMSSQASLSPPGGKGTAGRMRLAKQINFWNPSEEGKEGILPTTDKKYDSDMKINYEITMKMLSHCFEKLHWKCRSWGQCFSSVSIR